MLTVSLNIKVKWPAALHNTSPYNITTNSYSKLTEKTLLFISFKPSLKMWNIFLNTYILIITAVRITSVKSLLLKIFPFCRLAGFFQPFIVITVSDLQGPGTQRLKTQSQSQHSFRMLFLGFHKQPSSLKTSWRGIYIKRANLTRYRSVSISLGNFFLSSPEFIPIFAHVELHRVGKYGDQTTSANVLLDGITKERGADPAGGRGKALSPRVPVEGTAMCSGKGPTSRRNAGSVLHDPSRQDFCQRAQNTQHDTFLNVPPVSIYWAPQIPAGWGALERLIVSILCKVPPPSFRNPGDSAPVLHSAVRPRVSPTDVKGLLISLLTSVLQIAVVQWFNYKHPCCLSSLIEHKGIMCYL